MTTERGACLSIIRKRDEHVQCEGKSGVIFTINQTLRTEAWKRCSKIFCL